VSADNSLTRNELLSAIVVATGCEVTDEHNRNGLIDDWRLCVSGVEITYSGNSNPIIYAGNSDPVLYT